ncbi:MAG: hypothetical protein L0229_20320 [Blastocatellia bacterium]|nr:hypothetical protein [Blastocatellia bacterium]
MSDNMMTEAAEMITQGQERVWLVTSDTYCHEPQVWTENDRDQILRGFAVAEYGWSVTDTPEAIEAIAAIEQRLLAEFLRADGVREITAEDLPQ